MMSSGRVSMTSSYWAKIRVGALTGSGQKSGSGQKIRVECCPNHDDVSMMSASSLTGSKNGSGQNRFDRVGQVTGSS